MTIISTIIIMTTIMIITTIITTMTMGIITIMTTTMAAPVPARAALPSASILPRKS